MGITTKTVKILWAAAGGRCGFPDCWERLCYHEAGPIAPYTLGEMAHICGDKPGSNRHNPDQTDAERDDYRNLILLCPTHHTLIDRKENEAAYPVELLLEMKAAHEARILDLLDLGGSPTKGQLARSRSEEHTSELQSLMRISYAVFCLKKKNKIKLEYTRY